MAFIRLLAVLAVAGSTLLMAAFSTLAEGNLSQQAAAWYAALNNNDQSEIAELLSDDAIIELRDIGVIQNRTEFLDSLDEWAEIHKGAEILTQAKGVDEGMENVDVCYRFVTNETLIREQFVIEAGKIKKSIQEYKGDQCHGF